MASVIKEIARKLVDGSYENIAIGAKAENVITSHDITAEKILNTADVYNIEITVDKWSEGYNEFGTEIIIQDNEYTWEEILNKDIINLHFYAVDWGANATNYFRREEGYSNLSSVTFVYRTLNWSSNEVMTHYLYANLDEPYKFEFRIHRYEPATQLSKFDNDTNFVNKEYVDNLIPKNYIEIVLSENIGLDEAYEGVITEEQLAQLKQENSTAIKIINTSTDSIYYLLPSSVGEYENDFSGVYSQIGWDSANEMFINQVDINNTSFIYTNRLKLIPFKTSHLENDSGFIMNTVDNLTNYYKKTEIYTQEEINNLLNTITTLDIQVVTELPTENISTTTIYLKGAETDADNDYEEWIYTNDNWELIGTTAVDLSNYYTQEETDSLLNNKQEKLISGENIKTINDETLLTEGNLSLTTTEQFNKIVDIISAEVEDLIYTTPWTLGYLGVNGDAHESSTIAKSDKITVSSGDVITCTAKENGNTVSREMRFVTAFVDGVATESLGGQSLTSYTVPENVNQVVISVSSFTYYTNYTLTIVRNQEIGNTYLLKREPLNNWTVTKDSFTDGDKIEFLEQNVKTRKIFTFSGNITSFGTLKMGRIVDGVYKEHIELDSSNLKIYNTYGAETILTHNLNIVENIQVVLTTGVKNRLENIVINSCGIKYEATGLNNITWNDDKGIPTIEVESSTLTDCSAMWTCRTKNQPVWIFGDSYLSLDSARWPYYLIQDGYDSICMINGYAGENSLNAYLSLENLLTFGRPQYLIWCLGMNDGDSSTAVNSSWNTYFTSVKNICNKYGITLIAATIPTTPTVNNDFKNEIIRNSGYRYIDFAKGVNASESGWITGALSTDNVHPTAAGAIILYNRFLNDFPEITTFETETINLNSYYTKTEVNSLINSIESDLTLADPQPYEEIIS